MSILFCFAACFNNSTTNNPITPEVVATYKLNGDTIYLYDDNTFVITLKNNAGTISGIYAKISNNYKLSVTKVNGGSANPGDVLEFKATGTEISVISSDIGEYNKGDSGEQTGDPATNDPMTPEVVAMYKLNGDTIYLYDDNTFVITLKDNAGTISGTYAKISNNYKLIVTKSSSTSANPGDVLEFKVTDGKVSVTSSDIGGYDKGDSGEQTINPSQTTPNGSQGDTTSDIDYSLVKTPSEEFLIAETDFSAEENADGIYIKFAIPANAVEYYVYIDGIGQVAENWFDKGISKDDFFYPFVNKNTEYTVRVIFLSPEEEDAEGYTITIDSVNRTVGWFDVKAKAGANSKGEVRIKDFGVMDVKKNGDFTFMKKLTFENENVLNGSGYDWVLGVGLNEGVSWDKPNRRSKWLTELDISNKELVGKTYNFYTYPRPYGDVTKVDFVFWRPKMSYQYGGKEYKYQWDGKILDTDCMSESDLLMNIDVTKFADVAKIQGKWRYDEVFYDDPRAGLTTNFTELYDIDDNNIAVKWINVITKRNGGAFTKKEIADNWCSYYFSNTLPDDCFYYEEGEFYYDSDSDNVSKPDESSNGGDVSFGSNIGDNVGNASGDNSINLPSGGNSSDETGTVSRFAVKSSDGKTSYEYKIYTLYSYVTLSSDLKTLTEKYEGIEQSLSEYFADYNDNFTRHYDLKLFDGRDIFRVSWSGKSEDGTDYKWHRDFKKQ